MSVCAKASGSPLCLLRFRGGCCYLVSISWCWFVCLFLLWCVLTVGALGYQTLVCVSACVVCVSLGLTVRSVWLCCVRGVPVTMFHVYLCQHLSVDKRDCSCLHIMTVCCATVTAVWRVSWPCCVSVAFAGGCGGKNLGPPLATKGLWGPQALGPGCLFFQVSASALRLRSVTQVFRGHGSPTHSCALTALISRSKLSPDGEGLDRSHAASQEQVARLSDMAFSVHICLPGHGLCHLSMCSATQRPEAISLSVCVCVISPSFCVHLCLLMSSLSVALGP